METGWILPLSYHPKTIIMDPHDPQVVLYWMDYGNVGAEKYPLCWKSRSDVKTYSETRMIEVKTQQDNDDFSFIIMIMINIYDFANK